MGRFTKRLIGGLAAALTLAGGAFAGEYLITNFDNGTNQHNMGYYYYSYGSGSPADCHATERALVVSAGGPDEFGPLSYVKQGPNEGGACKSPPYCGALRINPLPAHVAKDDYYPAFGFGMSLTKSDTTGYGDDFKKVDSIAFWAMTESPGVNVYFKVETIENSPVGNGCGGKCGGYETTKCLLPNGNPTVDKDNKHTNSYMISFLPTGEWKRYSFAIKPVTPPAAPGTGADAEDGNMGGGKAGDLKQPAWYGTRIDFKPENVTKIAWAINSDATGNATLVGFEANVYIDDVVLVGSQVNPDFYLAPWICDRPGSPCVSNVGSGPSGSFKWLSQFEGDDFEDETTNFLRNSRGYYWYSYTDQAGGGTSQIFDLIENPNVEDEHIMDTDGKGRQGRGASILFETGTAYKQDGKDITAFVGIGTNLSDSAGGGSDYLNATAFSGVYFEYKTGSDVEFVNVEITDMCDENMADKDGEVLFTQIPGTGGDTWKAATIPFTKFVLPGWVETNGTRRGPGSFCGETFDKGRLAQLKFKIEGDEYLDQTLAIDNVAFIGATAWGSTLGTKLASSKVKAATGLRATYNRGVVGVSWNAAQNIASGKVSLVNVKGRTVATAPLVKAGGKVTANLGKGTIPTGMYFVRLNAKDVQGKKVVQQVPLSIVK